MLKEECNIRTKQQLATICLCAVALASIANGCIQYSNQKQVVEQQTATITSLEEQIQSNEADIQSKNIDIHNLTQSNNEYAQTIESQQKELEQIASDIPHMKYLGKFDASYYCGEEYPHICGTGNGITASGVKAISGITIAADTSVIPMGSYVYIEGVGVRIVQDRGGGIKGNKLDIFVDTHDEALEKSVLRDADVWIIE